MASPRPMRRPHTSMGSFSGGSVKGECDTPRRRQTACGHLRMSTKRPAIAAAAAIAGETRWVRAL